MPGSLIPLVILGPTATGKSDIAARVARLLSGRVINADSIQVYRGLEAGSCKPSRALRDEIPHYLVDVADPSEPFSAGEFARRAAAAIEECQGCGVLPIIAGGTGLYLRALLQGIAPMPARDEGLRSLLYARAKSQTCPALHADLASRDPQSAARIGPNDLQRIVRALEVVLLTGRPLSEHIAAASFNATHRPAVKVGLQMKRDVLYARINRRVDEIFNAGIVAEVAGLLADGLRPDANSLKALGYREAASHLRGEISLGRAIELARRNTRRFSRRQMIWFSREPGIRWMPAPEHEGNAAAEVLAGAIIDAYRAALLSR